MLSLDFLHCFRISDNYLMVRLPRNFLDGVKKEANVSGPCRGLGLVAGGSQAWDRENSGRKIKAYLGSLCIVSWAEDVCHVSYLCMCGFSFGEKLKARFEMPVMRLQKQVFPR